MGHALEQEEYERHIYYLDYIENGQRVRGAGFLKVERRNQNCNISLQVGGLYRRDSLTRGFHLLRLHSGSGENEELEARELCKIRLSEGGAKIYFDRLDIHNLDGNGFSYEELTGVWIPITENKEIRCLWRQEPYTMTRLPRVEWETQEPATQESEVQESAVQEWETQKPATQERETQGSEIQGSDTQGSDKKGTAETGLGDETTEKEFREREFQEREFQEREFQEREFRKREFRKRDDQKESRPEKAGLNKKSLNKEGLDKEEPCRKVHAWKQENKWSRLWEIYPHITPFGDDREYLSLGLQDFVLLPERFYGMVGNSFLLHGYYSYQHVALIRVMNRGRVQYYLGVPGRYAFEEKRAAVLFGFGHFECKGHAAEDGEYGYYLTAIEI